MVNINIEIDKLIDFALDKNIISKWDIELSRNEILDLLDLDSYEEAIYEKEISESPVEILERISEWAVENKKVEDDLTENVGKGHFKIKTETRFRKVSVFFS